MYGAKKRKAVTPIKDQDPNTVIRDHVVKQTDASNVLVSEYDVIEKQRPTTFWMRDLNIPRWLLLTLVSLAVIAFTAFAVFAAVVTLKKQGNGDACKSNSDCRQDLGLICNNYRCGCAYSHFWSDSYQICERRRMINRTCVNDSWCDALGNLQCQNVSVSTGGYGLQCQCKSAMTWNGYACAFQGLYNATCTQDSNCDNTRYLYCYLTAGLCRCNSSMFWNGASSITTGTCEYKRTINQFCYPYDNTWCDNTAPIGQGLYCTQYANPYGSEYGLCQCPTTYYYNGTAALANGFCVQMHTYGQTCTSTSQCDYRVNLVCTNNVCTCPSSTNYDPTYNITGYCLPAAGYLQNCTNVTLCSSSQNLYCNYNVSLLSNWGTCNCNDSWSFWDGTTCASKLSIGGKCTLDIQCRASDGLTCSVYTQSTGTCDCNQSYYWNGTCTLKLWYNISCTSNYVCDDNRGLQCQGLGGTLFQKCDCYNTSYIWDSLYTNYTRNNTCMLKIAYNYTGCNGDLECQDYNYLKCQNHTCGCYYTDYWDGSRCQVKRNYTDPCNYTYYCRDFSPVGLICRLGASAQPALQCLCPITPNYTYWSDCLQQCVTAKQIYQPCTLVANCTSNECDQSKNLQCLANSTGSTSGWCNCTVLQWWNGSYCRDKGIPAWGSNTSAICNATYQCADYNLVSCPLGGNTALVATCECATTNYWNGLTCLARGILGDSCTSFGSPVSTSTCLSAAGAGLICSGTTPCAAGAICTGGTCVCSAGTWDSTFKICVTTAG